MIFSEVRDRCFDLLVRCYYWNFDNVVQLVNTRASFILFVFVSGELVTGCRVRKKEKKKKK